MWTGVWPGVERLNARMREYLAAAIVTMAVTAVAVRVRAAAVTVAAAMTRRWRRLLGDGWMGGLWSSVWRGVRLRELTAMTAVSTTAVVTEALRRRFQRSVVGCVAAS